jgi:hypothetical protein
MIVTGETLTDTSSRGRAARERLDSSGREVAGVRQFVARALDQEMPTFAECRESLQIDTAHFVLGDLWVGRPSRHLRYDSHASNSRWSGCCLLQCGLAA